MFVSNTARRLATRVPALVDDLLDLFHRVTRDTFTFRERLSEFIDGSIGALGFCRRRSDNNNVNFTSGSEWQSGNFRPVACFDANCFSNGAKRFSNLHGALPHFFGSLLEAPVTSNNVNAFALHSGKTECGCAYFSLQKPLAPELTVMIDLVVILDGINIDKIEALAQTGRVG